ncbi:cytochrome b-c1 complex, subunit 6 [Cynara cardunculus var. scolymus]|uniref:Complex III subunit VI n=1 Tax=Cynara cardunculus var. scolymus TaxID=59895 RepID=A0A103Y3F1_CYNCS|nr:cytochrome b-c1 complex, subunit 6 [Cynara cardunculus var. scolymus]
MFENGASAGDSFERRYFAVFVYNIRVSLCRMKNQLTRRSILKIYANPSVLELGLTIRAAVQCQGVPEFCKSLAIVISSSPLLFWYHGDAVEFGICFAYSSSGCVKRVQADETGHKHCTGQYFDYWQCVDKCVAPKLFAKLK